MAHTTHSARITGPVAYVSGAGESNNIPLGPCLIEDADDGVVDVVWGLMGERSAALPVQLFEAAEKSGHIVLLG